MILILTLFAGGCEVEVSNPVTDSPFQIADETIIEVDIQDSGLYAVSETGRLYAWGWNGYGKIGAGLTEEESWNITSPTYIDIPEEVILVESGSTFACALTSTHELYGWGSNLYSELANADSEYSPKPMKIELPEQIVDVSVGAAHALALGESGVVYSWGYNEYYALGDGSNENRYTPISLNIPEKVLWIEAGSGVGYAMTESGVLYGWGNCEAGQLGIGSIENSNFKASPIIMDFPKSIKKVSCGDSIGMLLTEDGDLYTWGSNYYGSLGQGDYDDRMIPTKVSFDEKIVTATSGAKHMVAITESNRVYVWGWNETGQLGLGDETNRNSPVELMMDSVKIVDVKAGIVNTLAITDTRQIYGWGGNESGVLLDDTFENRNKPILLPIN